MDDLNHNHIQPASAFERIPWDGVVSHVSLATQHKIKNDVNPCLSQIKIAEESNSKFNNGWFIKIPRLDCYNPQYIG